MAKGLTFGNPSFGSGGNGSSVKVGKGAYVSAGTIVAAQLEYNTRMFPQNTNGPTDDVGLRLRLKVDGLSFEKDVYLGGIYKKENGMIVGWGSVFRIARVFDVLGIEGTTDENGRFDPISISQLQGREIVYLNYVRDRDSETGKLKYSDYRKLDAMQTIEETLQDVADRLWKDFSADVNDGWVTNYHPELADEKIDDSAPTATTSAWTEPVSALGDW